MLERIRYGVTGATSLARARAKIERLKKGNIDRVADSGITLGEVHVGQCEAPDNEVAVSIVDRALREALEDVDLEVQLPLLCIELGSDLRKGRLEITQELAAIALSHRLGTVLTLQTLTGRSKVLLHRPGALLTASTSPHPPAR